MANELDRRGWALRRDGWTAARRMAFLDHLSQHCCVRAAAAAAGMKTGGLYRLRQRDPAFAALWRDALTAGYEALEMALLATALNRVDGDGPVDFEAGLRLLGKHRSIAMGGYTPGGPPQRPMTSAEADAAILKKLERLEARLNGGGE